MIHGIKQNSDIHKICDKVTGGNEPADQCQRSEEYDGDVHETVEKAGDASEPGHVSVADLLGSEESLVAFLEPLLLYIFIRE